MPYISFAERYGIEKGIEKRNLEIAECLLEEGLALSLIKKVTGLSLPALKALQKNRNLKNFKNNSYP